MNASVVAGSGERYKVVGLVCGGHFFSHFSGLMLPPLFPLLKADFEVSYVALGSLSAAYAVALGAAQVPFGFLVDRFGGRRVLVSGLALLGGAFAVMGLATEYWQLMLLMILAGLGNSVFHPADYAILSARIDKGFLGRAMSMHSFSGYAGWAVAPAFMLGVSQLTNWRTALVVAGLTGVALAVLMAVQGWRLDDAASARARERTADSESPWRQGLRLMTSVPMLMMFGFFLFSSIATSGLMSFSVVATMALHGVDEAVAGIVLTGFLVALASGVIFGGLLADYWGRHNLVTSLAVGTMAILVASVSFGVGSVYVALAALAAAGLLYGIATPSRDLLVRAATPAGSVGVAFGFASTGMGIGAAIGPVMCGWLMDAGQPDGTFLMIAGALVFAVAMVFVPRTYGENAAKGAEAAE